MILHDITCQCNNAHNVLIFTARKRSCGKVMFLHLSVILFRGGGALSSGSLSGGVSVQVSRGRVSVPGVSVQGGSLPRRPPTPLYGNEWAVCILLECILILTLLPPHRAPAPPPGHLGTPTRTVENCLLGDPLTIGKLVVCLRLKSLFCCYLKMCQALFAHIFSPFFPSGTFDLSHIF